MTPKIAVSSHTWTKLLEMVWEPPTLWSFTSEWACYAVLVKQTYFLCLPPAQIWICLTVSQATWGTAVPGFSWHTFHSKARTVPAMLFSSMLVVAAAATTKTDDGFVTFWDLEGTKLAQVCVETCPLFACFFLETNEKTKRYLSLVTALHFNLASVYVCAGYHLCLAGQCGHQQQWHKGVRSLWGWGKRRGKHGAYWWPYQPWGHDCSCWRHVWQWWSLWGTRRWGHPEEVQAWHWHIMLLCRLSIVVFGLCDWNYKASASFSSSAKHKAFYKHP